MEINRDVLSVCFRVRGGLKGVEAFADRVSALALDPVFIVVSPLPDSQFNLTTASPCMALCLRHMPCDN